MANIMSGKLLTICQKRAKRSNLKTLRLLRTANNDKYLTGHDIIGNVTYIPHP